MKLLMKMVFVLGVIISIHAYGTERRCTAAEAQKAEEDVSRLEGVLKRPDKVNKAWDVFYRSFKKYGHCDDGGIAEGYGGLVIKLLEKNWKHLSEFVKLGKSDPQFFRFVLRHIDATALPEELETIQSNAAHACPAGVEKTCKDIGERCNTVVAEERKLKGQK